MSDSITLTIGPTSVPVTLTGVKALGVPADIDFAVTPAGGSPVAVGSIPAAPDGAYSFAAAIPDGNVVLTTTTSATLSASASANVTVPPIPSGLVATILYNGVTYEFDELGGTVLQPYVDPQGRFTMTNTMATNPGLPNFTVFFRRNTDGSCEHTVFEYGNPRVTVAPTNLGAYTATISKAGTVLHTENVPNHFWFARWRWPQSPYPVTVTPAALIASGMLPHYDASVLGQYSKDYAAQTYTPMTLAGLAGNMGQTGERGDIGLVTEWQADYICKGTNLPTVLAQAEAGGTFPWITRDPTTGAPYNHIANPNASKYGNGLPNIFTTSCHLPSGQIVYTDEAHEPELWYLPFLLTGDPFYLEGGQFQGVENALLSPRGGRYTTGLGVRAVAWGLRTSARLATVTPASVPSWLLPQSVWAADLSARVAWLTAHGVNTTSIGAPFQMVECTPFGNPQPLTDFWECDFITASLLDALRLGQTIVQPVVNWAIQQVISRTNGTSGWPRARCTMYNCVLSSAAGQPVATTWPALWAANLAFQPSVLTFSSGDPTGENQLAIIPPASFTYMSYARGVLAMASRLGIAGAAAPFAWIDGETKRQLATASQVFDRKWMIT